MTDEKPPSRRIDQARQVAEEYARHQRENSLLHISNKVPVFKFTRLTMGHGMCENCRQLERKIERYRLVANSINDQLTIDRLNEMIKVMEDEKAKLHPNQQ